MSKGQKRIDANDVMLANAGDKQALNRVVKQAHSLIWKLANSAARTSGISADDLSQAGFLGLLKGLPKFDADRGVKPSTFLFSDIRAEMMLLIKKSPLVKGPRSIGADKVFWRIRQTERKLIAKNGSCTDQEIADCLDVPLIDVQNVKQATQAVKSLHARQADGSQGRGLEDTLKSSTIDPESHAERSMSIAWVRSVVDTMRQDCTVNEQAILTQRIMADDPISGDDLGSALGISRQAVCMTESKLRAKLAKRLTNAAR